MIDVFVKRAVVLVFGCVLLLSYRRAKILGINQFCVTDPHICFLLVMPFLWWSGGGVLLFLFIGDGGGRWDGVAAKVICVLGEQMGGWGGGPHFFFFLCYSDEIMFDQYLKVRFSITS